MKFIKAIKYWVLLLSSIFLVLWWFSLPKVLFKDPLSCVVNDQKGSLIGAKIASDGQWRFPSSQKIPHKFKQSILYFEDEYFQYHPGFNPISIAKALRDNFTQNNKRGGSSITQQVIRLSRKNKKRTYAEKFIELVKATRLEARFSKDEVLELYANYAPFGGNVVGLEAACWRYFGTNAADLTWGQASTLAVLPNAPSLIYPGKNQTLLLAKRNRLLKKLWKNKVIDQETYKLAILEDLPEKPFPLPSEAFHFTEFVCQNTPRQNKATSLDLSLQQDVNQIASKHHQSLAQNNIYNLAILVIENNTRKVKAYVGNHSDNSQPFRYVDLVQAKRSSGSTLKPFLYASGIEQNEILPHSLLRDVPISFSGYQPKNFNEQFQGLVPANEALSRSLNIPFVYLLDRYGLDAFYEDLQQMKLKQINKGTAHYGLPLILGGAEVSLWELTQAYVNFKSIYSHYLAHSGQYFSDEVQALNFSVENVQQENELQFNPVSYSASSVYFTLKAMMQLNRPEELNNALNFAESYEIAWKTGTSYGFKDAWSVGLSEEYTVGVWVGNASTEGRPQLTGIKAAAPIMFDVFKRLPQKKTWLLPPHDDLKEVEICKFSGEIASKKCDQIVTQLIPITTKNNRRCSYHTLIDVDDGENFQVNRNCYPTEKIKTKAYVQLSPVEAYYTPLKNAQLPPPTHPDCGIQETQQVMEFIYPRKGESIILPRGFDETKEEVVFQLVHAKNQEVYWYINQRYTTSTREIHELSLYLAPGEYSVSVIDNQGNQLSQRVKVEEN